MLAVLVVPGSGDDADGDRSTTTAITVAGDDSFFSILTAPRRVEVTATEGGTVRIDVEAVAGATSYEAVAVVPSADAGTRIESAEPVILSELAVADNPCWIVRALGDGGRISDDSETACAPTG